MSKGSAKSKRLSRRELIRTAGLIGAATAIGGPLSRSARAAQDVIGMCPKFTSDPYFVAVNSGAQDAAKELGVTVEFQGPVNADVAAQADIIDRWIRRKVTAITVSANDPNALAPAMRRAMGQGIKVSTFDADVLPDARQVFLNQSTFDGMGKTMVDMMVRDAGEARAIS